LLSEKARQWSIYTCGCFYEKCGDIVYNTAALYGRAGRLAGKYEKWYPYDPELDKGAAPGPERPRPILHGMHLRRSTDTTFCGRMRG